MFNLFKPYKLYCVQFSWFENDPIRQEIVKAKDVAQAWQKVQRKHNVTAQYCYSITEITSDTFKGDKK